jgi:peptidoglycan/xylan/chitin deacetylase (PgdA/CDA1 family)
MKKLILLIMIVLWVSACGNTSGQNELNEDANQDKNQSGNNPILEEVPDQLIENEKEKNETEPVEEEPIEEEPEPKEIEISYYMNKIYDIKPINPEDNDKVVLLTFDDGPKEQDMITEMLEILDKHQAKAIFFVNGYRVKSNPDLLIQIHEADQIIGNHSWDHIRLDQQTPEKVDQQIEDVQNYIEELIGERPQFFRAPHGASNEYVRGKVKEENMLYMTWSAAAEEWVPKYQSAEAIVEHIMEQLRPGSNILMHELSWTVEGLDRLLTRITEEGYSFVDPRSIHLETGNPKEAD